MKCRAATFNDLHLLKKEILKTVDRLIEGVNRETIEYEKIRENLDKLNAYASQGDEHLQTVVTEMQTVLSNLKSAANQEFESLLLSLKSAVDKELVTIENKGKETAQEIQIVFDSLYEDIADLKNEKVDVNQGQENSGKYLRIGSNGEIYPDFVEAGTVTAIKANGKQYNPDNQGVVDIGTIEGGSGAADSVSWDNVTGKPETYPAEDHTHAWDDVTGKPETFPPEVHSHVIPWDSVTGKPDTFPPESHAHSWDSVTGKPETYPAADHTHGWASITGKPDAYTPEAHTHSEYMTSAQVETAITNRLNEIQNASGVSF